MPGYLSLKPKPASEPGPPALFLDLCFSSERCTDDDFPHGEHGLFVVQEFACSAGDGLLFGEGVSSFMLQVGGTCRYPQVSDGTVSVSSDGELVLDILNYEADDYQVRRGMSCSPVDVERVARGGRCFRHQTVRASMLPE
ncbi:MAG TPA: hypothetical protein VK524_04580 [Polyangiaceae bacterium]|nr:hypothetical protein [Polyangiaceae bacterium]